MEATHSDVTQIAVVVLVAVALGLVLVRLRQPPIVGYILAGIVLGPTGLGFVAQSTAINVLAELGVLLLLFLIGMELSLRAFMMVLKPALITAGLQILTSLGVTFAFGYFAGWTVQASILLGFAIAVSSTALVIKMLEDIDELRSDLGRITIGVLIAQDLAIVPILLLSEALGVGEALDASLALKMAFAIVSLFALVWLISRPGKIVFPFSERIRGRSDLLTLTMLAMCLAGAALSGFLGLSAIYGAFVAGLVIGQTNLRSEAIPATRPVQSLLIVVFFLSVGLLIDLDFMAENWAMLLLFVLGVIAIKSVFNVAILRLVGERWEIAFPAGIIMSQVGEFSFVTAAVGLRTSVIDYSAYQTVIAVIAVSLLISPFWLITVRRFHDVAQTGVQNFRLALSELYEDEIAGMEKRAAGIRRAGRGARQWIIAAYRATLGNRRAARRPSGGAVEGEAAPVMAMSGAGGARPGEEAASTQDAPPGEEKPAPRDDATSQRHESVMDANPEDAPPGNGRDRSASGAG